MEISLYYKMVQYIWHTDLFWVYLKPVLLH